MKGKKPSTKKRFSKYNTTKIVDFGGFVQKILRVN